ncbi:MAG: YceD family protein [Gaiellaceae bacterium]
MTAFDLRRLRLRSGEEHREEVEIELEPLRYGGQQYLPHPATVPARLSVARAIGGSVFSLAFDSCFAGPCYRCLADAEIRQSIATTEYQDDDPGDDDELQTPYLLDDVLDLTAWARDAIALALPEKVLCKPDCAGLCPVCGRDLNLEPHKHEPQPAEHRWAGLEQLRDRL